MVFFLKVSGIFSSFILFATEIQITSISIDLDSVPGQQIHEEVLFDNIGTGFIGFGCFTGPFLFGMASLIEKEKWQEETKKNIYRKIYDMPNIK